MKYFVSLCIILYAAIVLASSHPRQSGQPNPAVARKAAQLCARLAEVKVLPFKDERVDDPVYNGLVALGRDAVPCLVREITNTKFTHDPRKAPHYEGVRIGDVAFWILERITPMPYSDLFPRELSKRFADEGVYAYFDWVNKPGHRRTLQQNVKSYLANGNAVNQPLEDQEK